MDGIKEIINVNKFVSSNITLLEEAISKMEIHTDRDKANFGNLCVALRGFRMVSDATEALLINSNVVKSGDEFYQKLDVEDTAENNNKPEEK